MAVIKGSFYAESLYKITNYTAILPDKNYESIAVLYLLHGRSGDANSWLNQTGLVRYLKDLPIAVFCPEVDLSYYQDMPMGANYWTYVIKEFPSKIKQFHPYVINQEFVAGNSMGGYGALKWLLAEPKRFTAGGLFSPLVNPQKLLELMPETKRELLGAFGSLKFDKSPYDLLNKPNFEQLPTIYHSCGKKDFLHESSLQLSRVISKNKNYEFDISQGSHDWNEWDEAIQLFICKLSEFI